MPTVYFGGLAYSAEAGETVLEALERGGAKVPSSCRSGVCQTCLVKATTGPVPERAQQGLKPVWKSQGYLLACMCPALDGLSLDDVAATLAVDAKIESVNALSASVRRVHLGVPPDFHFQAGQFVNVTRPSDGVTRPYSIANLPGQNRIELHVALVEGGDMSHWLAASAGEAVTLRGPCGECVYLAGQPDEPLLLAGTGTGLAPLLGVARDALAQNHAAPIHLYHGSRLSSGIYLLDELRELETQHENLHVYALALDNDSARDDVTQADLVAQVTDRLKGLPNARVYLCGSPDIVRMLKKKAYLGGTPLAQIHSDPFVQAPTRAG